MFGIAKRLQRIFSKGIFSTLSECAPKKIFIISRKASMNFFEGCTHDYFQNIHPRKGLKQLNGFREFFFLKVYFLLFSKLAPKKTFVISRKASRKFF